MLRAARKDDAMDIGDDRYERRLVEETSQLRVEAAAMEVRLIDRIGQAESALRKDMSGLEVRLLKWSFAFWIGQVAAIGAIMAALLR